jgi:hypothetical protein
MFLNLIFMKMKKAIKISLVVVATLFFFLNVTFNKNGNRVEAMSLSTTAQTTYDHCELELDDFICYCEDHDYYCTQVCSTIYVRRCWDGE